MSFTGIGVPYEATASGLLVPPGAAGYDEVELLQVPVTQRSILNFLNGFTVTDDPSNLSTDIGLLYPGGGGPGYNPTGAISVDASTPPYAHANGLATTASFTPPNGATLVASVSMGAGATTTNISDSIGLNWTNLIQNAQNNTCCAVYVTQIGTGVSMTVSASHNDCGLGVFVLTGANRSQTGGGTYSNGTTGSSSGSLPTKYPGSMIIGAGGNWNSSTTPSPLAGSNITPNGNNFWANYGDGATMWALISSNRVANALASTGPYGVTGVAQAAFVMSEIRQNQ